MMIIVMMMMCYLCSTSLLLHNYIFVLLLKLRDMKETLYTLNYKATLGGGDTGEPETSTESTLKDLTKEKLDSWLYTLKEGDFGCSFGNFRIEEH
jgi:hypothetical protein